MSIPKYCVFGVGGIPEILVGDDLAELIRNGLKDQDTPLLAGDVLIVTQKIVSKAEGRVVLLDSIVPRPLAIDFAKEWGKDARLVELVLREAKRIVRMERGIIIVETSHGWICANAGIDTSNVIDVDSVTLLPVDSSASAKIIRSGLVTYGHPDVPVIVSDTFGRPWRNGLTNVAIGVSGLDPLRSYIGEVDPNDRELTITVMAHADELAAAAEPVMNKIDRVPVAVIRGLDVQISEDDHSSLIRSPEFDMFR